MRKFGSFFYWFEIFSVSVFTVEYLLRVWSCTSQEKFAKPFWGRLRFVFTPMALIDLIAILPAFLTFVTVDLRFIRTLRLFRLFRVFKFVRYSHSLKLFGKVIRNRKEELIVTLTIMFVLIILTSSFIYIAENEAQPDKFSDIPTSMWWAIVTLTTVGYGDVFPVTPLGKVFAAIIAVLGIGMFALPTGILGASFVEEMEKLKCDKQICPHCGANGLNYDNARREFDRRDAETQRFFLTNLRRCLKVTDCNAAIWRLSGGHLARRFPN